MVPVPRKDVVSPVMVLKSAGPGTYGYRWVSRERENVSSRGSFTRVFRVPVGRRFLYLHSKIGHGKGSRSLVFGTTIALRFPNFPWEQQPLERR